MNHKFRSEIITLSNYKGIMVGKKFLNITLTISVIIVAFYKLALSPLYILILLNALPSAIAFILRDYQGSLLQDKDFDLKYLKDKFQYTKSNYVFNIISFSLSVFLVLLWQINYATLNKGYFWFMFLPSFISITSIIIRFAVSIYYRITLAKEIMHHKN